MLAISQLWRRRHLLASPSEIGRLVGPHMENDPNELLLRAHTLLGNNVAREPHCRIESRLHAGNPSVLQVGDIAKAQEGTSEDGFPCLFVNEDWSRSRFHYDRVLRVVSDKISGRVNQDERTTEGREPG
jgi:hypothetical protein